MITHRSYNKSIEASDYLTLINKFYSKHHGFRLFYKDILKSLLYTIESPYQESTFLEAKGSDGIDGHIGISIDSRLPAGMALFGFFECIDDKETFRKLWDAAVSYARDKGLTNLIGPVNSSTFYQYRFNTQKHNSYRSFLSEPIHRDYYYDFFSSLKSGSESLYYSGLRTKFDSIINATEGSYHSTIDRGYIIEEYAHPTDRILKEVYNLSNKIFSKNWMYLPISEKDFRLLYDMEKISDQIGRVYVCRKATEAIGFASTLKDEKSMIIKTLGIDPEFQEQGIGNAIVHHIHKNAIQEDYSEVIYALIEEKNRVKYFTREDAGIIREYCAFNFKLKK